MTKFSALPQEGKEIKKYILIQNVIKYDTHFYKEKYSRKDTVSADKFVGNHVI